MGDTCYAHVTTRESLEALHAARKHGAIVCEPCKGTKKETNLHVQVS